MTMVACNAAGRLWLVGRRVLCRQYCSPLVSLDCDHLRLGLDCPVCQRVDGVEDMYEDCVVINEDCVVINEEAQGLANCLQALEDEHHEQPAPDAKPTSSWNSNLHTNTTDSHDTETEEARANAFLVWSFCPRDKDSFKEDTPFS